MPHQKNLYDLLRDEHEHDPTSLVLWYTLLDCFANIQRTVEGRLRAKFNVEMRRYDVMTALAKHQEGLTMGDLAELLMVTNGTITGMVNRLEQLGLVNKKVLKLDKRTRVVKLTRKGRNQWQKMCDEYEGVIKGLFKDLNISDIETTIEQLRMLQKDVIHH